jgi:cyclophilin family peptidyl-prolyl cis-trans isomerase
MKRLRHLACLIFLVLAPSVAGSQSNEKARPEVLPERVIFQTQWGDLVFAFYKDVAPAHTKQILQLVEAGAYQGTHIHRVEPNYLVQFSRILDRRTTPTEEQKNLEKPLRAEFSNTLRHTIGTLSMARMPDDPDSATSSFVVLLGDAPHLDGQFTIFGYLESGASTLKRIQIVPRQGSRPLRRITILRAFVHDDIDQYFTNHPIDPLRRVQRTAEPAGAGGAGESRNTQESGDPLDATGFIVTLFLVTCALSVTGLIFFGRLTKSHLLSLLMLEALVSGFGLLIFLTPWGQNRDWIAAFVFIGLLALFKFMNRFESKNALD